MESRAGYWLLEMELNTLLDILHPNTEPANLTRTRSENLDTLWSRLVDLQVYVGIRDFQTQL